MLTDKKYTNEHPKFNMFDKYKSDKDSLVGARADISGKDIDASKMKGFNSVDLDTAQMLSNNPTLTQEELTQLKKAAKEKKKLEPTGKFKE
jgi:rhamnose utilization protein RhaD (predicted bifunctional aldolase and dehydrogenase)